MNRYPLWKYAILLVALLVGIVYTLPNFFGEAPAVQVSAGKATVKVDATTQARVEQALAAAGLKPQALTLDPGSVRVRMDSTDTQLKAKDALQRALNPDPADPAYVVALRVGLGLGWMFVVAAEFMGASEGLGYLLIDGQQLGKPAQIVAAIVIFAILGKTTDWLIEIATAPLLRWQDAFGRQGGAA